MKRRILLVDDEVAVLLTLKAVLEISGFDVDTATSAREGISRLHTREYHMLITDMRMENDAAGIEVIKAARIAAYHPAVALLTAFPVADEDWQQMGADKLLVKPMHTRMLLQQIETLIESHETKLAKLASPRNGNSSATSPKNASPESPKKKTAGNALTKAEPAAGRTSSSKVSKATGAEKAPAKKSPARKSSTRRAPTAVAPAKRSVIAKKISKKISGLNRSAS